MSSSSRTTPTCSRAFVPRPRPASGSPVGGSWVEPDCNLPWGESICRQFLYGQRCFERTFGARSTVFWNPDVFGYDAQLPQLMKSAGMARFLTQKTVVEQVHLATAPQLPLARPSTAARCWRISLRRTPTNGSTQLAELRYHAANYKDADRSPDALYLFGYGDGGGGADETMLETLQRTKDLQGLPRIKIRTVDEFFDRLTMSAENFATIEGELYPRISPRHLHHAVRGQAPQSRLRGRPSGAGIRDDGCNCVAAAGAVDGRDRSAVAHAAGQPVSRHHPGQ